MPEGHTLHRLARDHRRDLAGRRVEAWSPQGRFAAGAARLDGRTLLDVEAYGKHLFYRWEGGGRVSEREGGGEAAGGGRVSEREGGETLHVHLGLFGTFRSFADQAPEPTANTRLALRTDAVAAYLAGPTACELIDPSAEDALRARLGPDPLRRDADPEAAYGALRRRRVPIGAALLDQRVMAGIGNVYRAEALFVCGIDPHRPAHDLAREEFGRLWDTLVMMLRKGVREGRIVTAGRRGRFVYRRLGEPCWRCGTPILGVEMAGRTLFSCGVCQGGDAVRTAVVENLRTP